MSLQDFSNKFSGYQKKKNSPSTAQRFKVPGWAMVCDFLRFVHQTCYQAHLNIPKIVHDIIHDSTFSRTHHMPWQFSALTEMLPRRFLYVPQSAFNRNKMRQGRSLIHPHSGTRTTHLIYGSSPSPPNFATTCLHTHYRHALKLCLNLLYHHHCHMILASSRHRCHLPLPRHLHHQTMPALGDAPLTGFAPASPCWVVKPRWSWGCYTKRVGHRPDGSWNTHCFNKLGLLMQTCS